MRAADRGEVAGSANSGVYTTPSENGDGVWVVFFEVIAVMFGRLRILVISHRCGT